MVDIYCAQVGQFMTLGVAPARFDRVEFRSIRWEPFELKPIRMNSFVGCDCCSMCVQAVPKNDDPVCWLVVQSMVQLSQKIDHFLCHETIECQLKVKRCMLLRWRQRQGANCRDSSIVPSRDQLQRCMPAWCPSTLAVGLQQKAGFVDKNDASFVAKPPFLSAASRASSTARRIQSPVRGDDAVASDTTSPTCVRAARHSFPRMLLQSTVRLPRRLVDRSKGRWEIPTLTHLVLGFAPHAVVETQLISTDGPDEALTSMHQDHHAQRPSAIAPRYSMRRQQAARPLHVNSRSTTSYLQSDASFRVPLQYLWFSCRNHTRGSTNRH